MATVIGVLDGEEQWSRTDVLVHCDPDARTLCWIPRDTFVRSARCRVNAIFARFGHTGLLSALDELGLPADHSVCITPSGLTEILRFVDVTVPVFAPLRFRFPVLLHRVDSQLLARLVVFEPPTERLRGLRVHEWIAARHTVPLYQPYGTDLGRIGRQQILVQRLLRTSYLVEAPASETTSFSHRASVLRDLARVEAGFQLGVLGPLTPERIDGADVLVLEDRA